MIGPAAIRGSSRPRKIRQKRFVLDGDAVVVCQFALIYSSWVWIALQSQLARLTVAIAAKNLRIKIFRHDFWPPSPRQFFTELTNTDRRNADGLARRPQAPAQMGSRKELST
jgi:hypothetical protein